MARDKCPKLKYCHCAKKICKKNQSPVRNGNLLHSFVLYGHLIAYADSRVSHINCAPDFQDQQFIQGMRFITQKKIIKR